MNKTVELALGAYEIDAQFVIARRNGEAISTSEASLRGGTAKQSPPQSVIARRNDEAIPMC